MMNVKSTIHKTLLGGLVAASLATAGVSQAVTIDNGVAAGTVGHWSVDVVGGGQSRDGVVTAQRKDNNSATTSEIIFDYYTYAVVNGVGVQLSTNGATLNSSGQVVSSGTLNGQNGLVNWTATSSIAAGSSILTNVFNLSSVNPLGNLSLLQYLDEDVDGVSDDVFFTRGSAATGNLQLYTIDNAQAYGISHSGAFSTAQGLLNAGFSGWAVDNYNDMKSRIEAGNQALSPTGVIEAGLPASTNAYVGAVLGPVDVVSVLGWTVDASATSATILTTLGGVPDINVVINPPNNNAVPEPATWALGLLAGLSALAARRRRAGR